METAILELGTRTFHLSRAALTESRTVSVTELGVERVEFDTDIDARGSLGRTAWANGLDAIGRLMTVASRARLRTIAVAPHALGDAENVEGFVKAVQRRFGVEVGLLSRAASARLVYRGVRRALSPIEAFGVVHLGDSSIEVAAGKGADCELTETLSLGIARLHLAYGATEQGLPWDDCQALLGLIRLSGGPVARRLREYGAPVVMASGHAGAVLEVARAWGYVDPQSPCIGRLALHALVQEILHVGAEGLLELGIEPWRAGLVGTAAVVVDALAGLLGQREVWLMPEGLAAGVGLEVLETPVPRLARAAGASNGYVPVTVA